MRTVAIALLASVAVASSRAAEPRGGHEAAAESKGEPISALIRRCVEAHGGKAALARAARFREEGTVTSLLHPGERGRILRVYERPGRLRVETSFGGAPPEVRVLDGGHGWRDGEEASGPRLAAMILQAMRLDLPALLSSWEAKVRDAGTLALGGKTLRVLAIEPAPGLVVEAAIDPATGRIRRSRGASTDPAMPIEFITTYADHRKIGGVLVAMHEQNWASGTTTGETVLEKVEFPKALPDAAFRP